MKNQLLSSVGAVLLIMSGLSCSASAADKAGQYAIKGTGNLSCAAYLAERSKASPTYKASANWIAGYISAYNRFASNTADITPWQDGPLFLDLLANVCNANKDKPLEAAINAVLVALSPQRLAKSDRLEARQLPGGTAQYYSSTWQQMEQQLRLKAHLTGNGRDPKIMAAALKSFQVKQNLRPTGMPDQATLFKLLMEK
jgi:hypothetical protein